MLRQRVIVASVAVNVIRYKNHMGRLAGKRQQLLGNLRRPCGKYPVRLEQLILHQCRDTVN